MVKVVIKPDDVTFDVPTTNNVLEAAIAQNLNLSYGCKNGLCGACKCKIISGEFNLDVYNNKVLTDEELQQGYTLLCKTFAKSDLVMYIPGLLSGYPIKILPAKIVSISKFGNVAIIKMKTPPSQKFEFFAGQYVEIILLGKHRSYSIANANMQNNEVEIHVKYHSGGLFSEYVWNNLHQDSMIRFKGPLGNFKLSSTNYNLIFVCTGTGFAPLRAMLQDCVNNDEKRNILLYWGNREFKDFYLLSELDLFAKQLNLEVKLCISRENRAGFNSGYVTKFIQRDFNNLTNHEVYACGNLNMIEDVYELCTKKLGLDKSRFYSDAFTPSV
jgi:CDP-4-dehydro-6-deoxyglucose reductase